MEDQEPLLLAVWRRCSEMAAEHNISQSTLSAAGTVIAIIAATLILRITNAIAAASVSAATSRPRKYTVPSPKVPEPHTTVDITSVKVSGSSAVQCYAPATGQFLGNVNPSTPAAIDRAVSAAATAQKTWAETTFDQRRAVLSSLLQHVLDNAEEIVKIACLDSGKTMVDAQLGEILVTAEKLKWTLSHGEQALRPSRRPTNFLMMYKRNTVHYEPLGIVAALVSWNYPFHNFIGPVISALFSGNGILVKVSEQTAWSSQYFTNIARGALIAHGHDPQLVQTIVCWPQAAGHLTSHPGISHITFIGSQSVAHHVAASAAKRLTPVVAELGGKDPFIVLDSASGDLKRIAEVILRGTFQAAGQNCIGIERVIAPSAIHDKLVEMLAPRVNALRLGPDADVGAMISDASFDRLEELIAEAVSQVPVSSPAASDTIILNIPAVTTSNRPSSQMLPLKCALHKTSALPPFSPFFAQSLLLLKISSLSPTHPTLALVPLYMALSVTPTYSLSLRDSVPVWSLSMILLSTMLSSCPLAVSVVLVMAVLQARKACAVFAMQRLSARTVSAGWASAPASHLRYSTRLRASPTVGSLPMVLSSWAMEPPSGSSKVLVRFSRTCELKGYSKRWRRGRNLGHMSAVSNN
ncbi:hypothetical protein NXS19_005339 [Fusarium pseudograminearum]|nr:hypothetical protein NXS19_005339 [Fusarium pseudograminearum]